MWHYYIGLNYNDNENLDYKTVVEMFSRLGAKRRYNARFNPETDGYVVMDLPKFYPITVYNKNNSEYMKGNLAEIRLPWVKSYKIKINLLTYIMDLADKIGCRVYDEQIEQFINRETIAKLEAAHGKSAHGQLADR